MSIQAKAFKYHPIHSSIDLAERLGAKVYSKITPPFINDLVKESSLVAKGSSAVISVRQALEPMISSIDGYASVLMEWALDKYQVIFYNNLMKFVCTVKDFYSSENNDFARITLRFLTLAIPQKDYIDSIYPQKFIESFKYDHQFSKESFQNTLNRFYIHAKEHWLVNQQSKPLDIVKNSLFIVASTMEDILFPHDRKIPGFAQKMSDYFCNDTPDRTLFSRKHFREFFKTLVRLPELDEV